MPWFGRAQGVLIGVALNEALAKNAAVVDPSDAWRVVDMQGELAVEAFARTLGHELSTVPEGVAAGAGR